MVKLFASSVLAILFIFSVSDLRMNMSKILLLGVTIVLAFFPAYAQVDANRSSVVVVSKQMGVAVEGRFKRFSAQVNFDPSKPASGSARVEMDIGSFDLGGEEFNREALNAEWLDVARYPKSVFVSEAIRPVGAGRFEATGKLSLKGTTLPVVIPFVVRDEAGQQVFEGSLPIRRLQYRVGDGAWKDTATVADEVVIKFKILNLKQTSKKQ